MSRLRLVPIAPTPRGLQRTGRPRLLVAAAWLGLAALTSGCDLGSHAADNRHPDMRHGNIEQPGSHAADNQGQAGR